MNETAAAVTYAHMQLQLLIHSLISVICSHAAVVTYSLTHCIHPGKWDVGMSKWEYTPTYRGFDTFYGFYGSDEDHFSHIYYTSYTDPSNPCERVTTHGVDLRRNTAPLTRENGSYSTHLFTRAIQEVIIQSQEEDSEKPFFVYGAYQAVHNPLQVPEEYLENCSSIPYFEHKIFCGMMQALDEGIMNITETLDDRGLLDNTVIILTTDNGGQTKQGSSNWPLRGNKGTVFEGGVRGVAFVWGQMLANTNYNYGGLMHITDWYKTIVEGIAGIDIGEDVTKNLDGYNMWQALTHNEPSPRSEILLQLNPPSYTTSPHLSHFAGQAAFRSGDWKLISGVPDCDPALKMSCPTGWVHLDGFIENPPFNPTLTWLFNVTADPNEKHNLAESFPDVVSQLKQRIEDFNSTHIPQVRPPFDPRADPDNFEGVWTPWLN